MKGKPEGYAHLTAKIDQLKSELAEAKEQRDFAVEALKIIGQQFMKVKSNTSAAITASMIKKVLKECGK